jgi:FeS assembly SUF system protein
MDPLSKNPVKLDPIEPAGDPEAPRPAAEPPAAPGALPEATPEAAAGAAELEDRVVRTLKSIYDPEIPVDIYELGLIYDIDVQRLETGERAVHVKMTLTSPACPVAGSLPGEVEQKVAGVEGVDRAEVEIVWDPAWNPSMMSEVAKLELGFF